jgi:L-iditol 2-dehydrogenase
MDQKRFDASLIHTHTFDMGDLPEAIRYARERVDGAIKVVLTNDFAHAKTSEAAE